jgi:hypothetical protein
MTQTQLLTGRVRLPYTNWLTTVVAGFPTAGVSVLCQAHVAAMSELGSDPIAAIARVDMRVPRIALPLI